MFDNIVRLNLQESRDIKELLRINCFTRILTINKGFEL